MCVLHVQVSLAFTHQYILLTTTVPNLFVPSPSSFSAAPRLVQLRLLRTADHGDKIEIIKTIAAKWKKVGDSLDFDSSGAALDVIEANQ